MPSRGVWFASDQLIYSLMARPEIASLRDLRGKKIGITGLGGTSHVALQIALEAAGENPKNFVYVVLGAPQQLPALETGTVDAAMFSPPFDFYAKKKKFREVLDVGAKVKMPLGGLTTMLSTIRNRPDEVKRVLRSMQLAKQEVLRSKEKATALILKYLQVDKEAADGVEGAKCLLHLAKLESRVASHLLSRARILWPLTPIGRRERVQQFAMGDR